MWQRTCGALVRPYGWAAINRYEWEGLLCSSTVRLLSAQTRMNPMAPVHIRLSLNCRIVCMRTLSLFIITRYQPSSEEMLLKAFEVLDQDKKSHLTTEELKKVLMEEGEPFSQEEMDEMLQAAVDPDRGTILYKDFVTLMLPEDEQV